MATSGHAQERSRFANRREVMIDRHILGRGIRNPRVLAAMREVPRESFVDPGMEEFAYEDSPLPIGERQTISQPYIVALMADAAEIGSGDKVLEVGTGSGYAAAVLSRLGKEIYTIERHVALAASAQQRFQALGYKNIHVRIGDGTLGWRECAPFDAIVVAAGSPELPPELLAQLAIKGRLIIPVERPLVGQRLRKVVRTGKSTYEYEDLGGVAFVPLVGEQGWREESELRTRVDAPSLRLPEHIARAAIPLPDLDDAGFASAFDRYADKRVVLLGECSHGTSEFYRARAAISRRLIEKHGFDFVAVEADWPDAAMIHGLINGTPPAAGQQQPFRRFPRWMWRNQEFAAFVQWMREYNADRDDASRLGFHGLDIYNLSAAMDTVLAYLDRHDPAAAKVARERYGCLTPWQQEPAAYGRAALVLGYADCEKAVVAQCMDMLKRHLEADGAPDRKGFQLFDAAHSARLVAAAERYYRLMYYSGPESWNARDTHMFETLDLLLNAYGPDAKGIVWAHNSHIGDASSTDMGTVRGETNIGQLCRERYGDQAALIGFGTHHGTVMAAHEWDGEAHVMNVRPSRANSVEAMCHQSGISAFLLDLRDGIDDALRGELATQRPERFIGVIYRPDTEFLSHYAAASLSDQFDGYVWFDRTQAVQATDLARTVEAGVPDTFPFGV